nr:AMP-binding protein [Solirubrobacterales bacterium]
RDVHLGGYSQGGMFAYQCAAYRRSEGIASLITFGSPVDTRGSLPLGLPPAAVDLIVGPLADVLAGHALPAWASRTGFRLLDPVKSLRQRVEFVLALHDREGLLAREGQRRFLMADGWVAWPGPALADLLRQFFVHNRMLTGGFLIGDRLATLADVTCPVLTVVGEVDEIAPTKMVRAIAQAAPRAEIRELSLPAGHFGLVVGGTATRITWPTVAEWVRWKEGEGEEPTGLIDPSTLTEEDEPDAPGLGPLAMHMLELTAVAGLGAARSAVGVASGTATAMKALSEEAATQLPRLARLDQVRPSTRISLGLLLDEQSDRAPEDIFFLFEDRGHTHAAAKYRIDSVVRGLISLGVRQGEPIGVLMGTRPSAIALVAALNRLGAVAVLMRPDGPVALEAGIGRITRVITDPELTGVAAQAGVPVLVLGGGGQERDLGDAVVDMERIDPEAVTLPAWYAPNPGLAADEAFVVFTGQGERTRANRITNGRWALSAFGTATAASLSDGDTVYSVTPISHPSGLMTSIGGAIAGGARIAMAGTSTFDPDRFWNDVRRYGVTVVSYTWTMLHDIVEAPPDAAERHHPIRLFIGAGMPGGLWRRLTDRLPPARVLEFYASTQGDAVLVHVSGSKPGCKGRRLPGSAQVRLAAYHADAGEMVLGEDGLARDCVPGHVGLLLSRVRADELAATSGALLRGVFARGDAWLSTDDLFREDEDGDLWLVDHAPALVHTAAGTVASGPVQDALGELEAVDLAVAYGVPGTDGEELAVAAVSLRADGPPLTPEDLEAALGLLEPRHRPTVVRVVDEIPVTTWFRPLTGPLRDEGLKAATKARPAWVRQPGGEAWQRLTRAQVTRITAG